MNYEIQPVGVVRTARTGATDDFWGGTEATIELAESVPTESLLGLDQFSHVEVLFLFDRVGEDRIVSGARHPRENEAWPKVGIFAQRGKNRPNRIGVSIVPIVRVEGRTLVVARLDAIDGTPVIDLKPVMSEFLPSEPVRQPQWSRELMHDYFAAQKAE